MYQMIKKNTITLENGKRMLNVDLEQCFLVKKNIIMEILKMINFMVKEHLYWKMEIHIMVIGKIINKMVWELKIYNLVGNMKVK